ncbi:MAG: ABC transporter permease subunit [Ignavibacteriaceae bacterium]|nr:ABC transporter permease subunit [Ignavibacteriaceae bacterium]
MITLLRIELFKIFSKWRSYIGFIAIGVLVPVIQIDLMLRGQQYLEFLTQNLQQNFVFVGNFLNGYLIGNIVLNALLLQIPFLITLVAGDLLAGEATAGTYRMLLTRPVSRTKVILSKFLAGIIYTNLILVWLALISLGLSILLFGTGELIVIAETITIFAKDDIVWRFALAYGYAALSMSVVTALGFMFSSLVENAIGPIVATLAIIIVFLILQSINLEFFAFIRPYLFTSYLHKWRVFFTEPIDYSELGTAIAVMTGHIATFFLITLYIFKKKDIQS